MAKQSMIQRELKRNKLVKKYAKKHTHKKQTKYLKQKKI